MLVFDERQFNGRLLLKEAGMKKYRTAHNDWQSSLKNPDAILHFVQELADTFTTDEVLHVGAKYDFSRCKVMRLLKALDGVRINKISHGSYTKMND